MRVLVVGGAGYIGSHMCKLLAEFGHEVVVCDNLSTGHQEAVRWGQLIHCQLSDTVALTRLFSRSSFDAVMHFAASSIVSDSLTDPLRYYRNNVSDTICLLQAMNEHGIDKFVFSSTAAVYGQPKQDVIDETHICLPITPYGKSKLFVEQILNDLTHAHRLRAVSLRYFNAAGADFGGEIGESHDPETHLIPRVLRMAAGDPIKFGIFGTDYATPDGTCIRDFVHVNDLCAAHLRALEFLGRHSGFHAFNLGNGRGYSVRQIVSAAEEVLGRKLNIPEYDRRSGDPSILVASSEKAQSGLDWVPQYPDIRQIIESAWKWHSHPQF
jgi:UDP-glucose 4-epimerase